MPHLCHRTQCVQAMQGVRRPRRSLPWQVTQSSSYRALIKDGSVEQELMAEHIEQGTSYRETTAYINEARARTVKLARRLCFQRFAAFSQLRLLL